MSFISALEETVRQYPDATAIIDKGQACSYQQLWDEAIRVAGFLKSKGIGKEDIVGINLPKSKDYIVSLLGTWMAGGAFMPLDPSLPQERIDFIISEAEPKYIISRLEFGPVVTPAELHPEDLAYVIYTSGSTGRPKGVMVGHRGLLPMLRKQVSVFGLAPGKKSLFYLSIAFDASVSDIGTSLLSGATLVIEDDRKLRDGAVLIKILQDKQITHFDCPPSLLGIFDPHQMPEAFETIIIGGEVCPPETVRKWAEKFRIVNVYGPTETTVCSSLCLCDAQKWQKPLIGQAVTGTDFKVLDGELYIAGDGLARGYLRQPALTAEKFPVMEGRRFYKTGDRVRVLPDGEMEFLGRTDRQFKLRGQLIAPEEIETQLLRCKGVSKAAVLKRPLLKGARVAFISPEDASLQEASLSLRKVLPPWMIPDHFQAMRSFPETASGKPDYNILKKVPLNLAGQKLIVSGLTPTEAKLFQAWQDILKHDYFGLDDSFFRIGGDSLGVIRLTLEAERFGVNLSPEQVTLYPTIRLLAKAIDYNSNSTIALAADLRKEVFLDNEFRVLLSKAQERSAEISNDQKNILLTGATGGLGSKLLQELLNKTSARIYCLVRAKDEAQAKQRLVEKSGLDDERMVAIAGDIEERNFGISPEKWARLSQETDAIYHCAAAVNMIAPYGELKKANVDGVKEVLRLALTGKRKHIHYASTLSVFVATNQNTGVVYEDDKLEKTAKVYGGYAQSKWVAECLLHQVLAEAAPVSQYRFGLITGDSRTGSSARIDYLSLFIRGIKSLGVLPQDDTLQHLAVDITPVDYAASAMADISLGASGGVYHIANARHLMLPDLFSSLRRCCPELSEVTLEEWKNLPVTQALSEEESAGWTALCRILPEEDFERLRTMDLFQSTDVVFDMSKSKFSCPPPGEELIDKYVRYILSQHSSVRRICLFGPESTGKSTLAQKLAEHFETIYVPEFAKALIESGGGQITPEDIPVIAAGQAVAEDKAAQEANKVLICDTDLLTTKIWSEWLFAGCPRWIKAEAAARKYDLYLLMDIDVPWVDDIHRFAPEKRRQFMEICEKELLRAGARYIKISGDWDSRFSKAVDGIAALMQEKVLSS